MRRLILLFYVGLISISCQKDVDAPSFSASTSYKTHKIAVVMPSFNQERWERIADWQTETMRRSQDVVGGVGVSLSIEWVDEDMDGLDSELERLANDESIEAIIGPYYSENAVKMAAECYTAQKCLILPTASSTELHRVYSGRNFMWILSESDFSQCEVLLLEAKKMGATEVSLICCDDYYGQSYLDWFGFQAVEMNLKVNRVYEYIDDAQLTQSIEDFAATYSTLEDGTLPYLVFAPSRESDVLIFDQLHEEYVSQGGNFPSTLCSDIAYSDIISSSVSGSYVGAALSADPDSGYHETYIAKFGEYPMACEAHLYDALSLATLGLYVKNMQKDATLNESIEMLVTGEGSTVTWEHMNTSTIFSTLKGGSFPLLEGAVGPWSFYGDGLTSLLWSTYLIWELCDGEFTYKYFTNTDPDNRESDTSASWEWLVEEYQSMDDDIMVGFDYPELENRWALVIAASEGWSNYRHQADAHSTYQMLKRHGYSDENIILIVADDVAYNEKNLYPGTLHVHQGGDNVYSAEDIDYRLGDLLPSDIYSILRGEVSQRTPEVISSTANDNIFIFWSGHGSYNYLNWGSNNYFTAQTLDNIITDMSADEQFRKLFIVLEACYSGSMGEYCSASNPKGVMFMTAANSNETSKADIKDTEMNIWLSNAFTRRFEEMVDEWPEVTMRELYYELAYATMGSHVSVYNYPYFGNMYIESMLDFIYY